MAKARYGEASGLGNVVWECPGSHTADIAYTRRQYLPIVLYDVIEG